MPEVSQYMFKYSEVAEALVKQAGLHEGKWQLVALFSLAAANVGPSDPEIVPGAVVGVTGIGLTRATETSPKSLVVDAAEINPASS